MYGDRSKDKFSRTTKYAIERLIKESNSTKSNRNRGGGGEKIWTTISLIRGKSFERAPT